MIGVEEMDGIPVKPYKGVPLGKVDEWQKKIYEKCKTIRRETIAHCIGADPEEIFFTSGGTESDNWAIKASAFADSAKKPMITSAFEHHAVLNSCAAIEQLGYPVTYIHPNRKGYITPDILEQHITDQTRFVSVMYANNELSDRSGMAETITKQNCWRIVTETHCSWHWKTVSAVLLFRQFPPAFILIRSIKLPMWL